MNHIRRCTDCVHSFFNGTGVRCTNPNVLANTPEYLSGDEDSAVAMYERAKGKVCGKSGNLFTSVRKGGT